MAAMAMPSGGDSAATRASKSAVLKIFNNEFRESCDEVKALQLPTFDKIEQSQACNRMLFKYFAFFLTNIYTQQNGTFLSHGSVDGYLGVLMTEVFNKFRHVSAPENLLFFTCRDAGTAENAWWHGIRVNSKRIVFERMMKAGGHPSQLIFEHGLSDTQCVTQAKLRTRARTQSTLKKWRSWQSIFPSWTRRIPPRESSASGACGVPQAALVKLHGYAGKVFNGTATSTVCLWRYVEQSTHRASRTHARSFL